jgi:hypothetical protein
MTTVLKNGGNSLLKLDYALPLRKDELVRFVLIRDPCVTVTWRASQFSNGLPQGMYHATANGVRSVCPALWTMTDEDPAPHEKDRSNCAMTCDACAELVRKARPR